MNRRNRILVPVVLLVSLVAVAGCAKKTPPPPPPPAAVAPPVVVPAPTAELTATPTVISSGDQVQLAWRTTNASSVSIDGIGDVPTSGVKSVTPTASTSYHLVARGEGGSADATARVTVNAPPVVEVPVAAAPTEEQIEAEVKAHVRDIFFDFDKSEIRADAQPVLSEDASVLNSHPKVNVLIGGYCDERGSNEYNIALGQKRADAAKDVLVNAGVAGSRIRTISYGKEKPFCTEHTEECWQQNRRGGFTLDR